MDLAANLQSVREKMDQACDRAGRPPASVRLVAVTKGQPPERVHQAMKLGLTLFGESRVQEAREKIGQCPGSADWHMIGHLQSNKCRDAIALFSMIHSVDSAELAVELNRFAIKAAKTMPILLEVNVAGESSKFGIKPEQITEVAKKVNELPKLMVHGLMTIAPYSVDPEKVRPCFKKLRELKEACEQAIGGALPELSIGMSGDFQMAIEEGATLIRVGTTLFGPR